jgi:spermidine synthase
MMSTCIGDFYMLDKSKSVERLVAVIFFFSGLSALIYQVVWQRLLTVHYGVGPISTALVVTVYMVGLGLGALFGGYLSERLKQRILIYCFVELGIGVFGVVSPSFLDFLGNHTAGSSYALSFVYIFIFLSIPTFLMGVTLPLLTKLFSNHINDFLGALSFLYFINTVGAAVGAIVSSYVIISFFGLLNAVYFAAAINFSISILIFLTLKLVTPRASPQTKTQTVSTAPPAPGLGLLAYPLVFVTGFLAIGYEIMWFRVIGLLAKDSPYAFSSVLSVYLLGIAVGSFGTKGFLERYKNVDKKSLFFVFQFVIGITIGLSFIGYFYLTKYTPFGVITQLSFRNELHPGWFGWRDGLEGGAFVQLVFKLFAFFDVFIWSSLFVLIPTLLIGASFPLISFLALTKENQEGRTVGLVYFFTIIGNAHAGILTGLLILPRFGTEPTLAIFCAIGIAFGIGAKKLGNGLTLPLRARGLYRGPTRRDCRVLPK